MIGRCAPRTLAVLLTALLISGCVTPEERERRPIENAVEAMNAAMADLEAATDAAIQEEFPVAARNCELPGAVLARDGEGYRLSVPADVYASRDRNPSAGRIACLTHWAQEYGVTPTIAEAR